MYDKIHHKLKKKKKKKIPKLLSVTKVYEDIILSIY